MGLTTKTFLYKSKQAQMTFFTLRSPFRRKLQNSYSSSCRGRSRESLQPLVRQRKGWNPGLEQGRLVCRMQKINRRKENIYIHISPGHMIYAREGQCMDSKVQCNFGILFGMASMLDVLGWLLSAADLLANDCSALQINWRGLFVPVPWHLLPFVAEHLPYELLDEFMTEISILYLCEGSHSYAFFPKKARKILSNALTLGEINIPPISDFWPWLQAALWPWLERYAWPPVLYLLYSSQKGFLRCNGIFQWMKLCLTISSPSNGHRTRLCTRLHLIVKAWVLIVTVEIIKIYRLSMNVIAVLSSR